MRPQLPELLDPGKVNKTWPITRRKRFFIVFKQKNTYTAVLNLFPTLHSIHKTMLSAQNKDNYNSDRLHRWCRVAWQEKITPLLLILDIYCGFIRKIFNSGENKELFSVFGSVVFYFWVKTPLWTSVSSCANFIRELCKYLF